MSTTYARLPATAARFSVVPMAFRSNAAGRQGIRIRSAARAAASDAASAFGALSIITVGGLRRLFEQAQQPSRLGGHHGRGGLVASVAPARRGSLRIEIERCSIHAPQLGGHRKVDADGRLAGPAFLADNGDRFHGCALIGCSICDHTCKH